MANDKAAQSKTPTGEQQGSAPGSNTPASSPKDTGSKKGGAANQAKGSNTAQGKGDELLGWGARFRNWAVTWHQVATVFFDGAIVVFTGSLVFFTASYSCTSKQQLQTMQQQMDLSERPWVSADLVVSNPLKFGPGGAFIGMNIVLRNVGHSVARYVSVWTALKPRAFDPRDQQELCGRPKAPINNKSDYGYLLFPGQNPVPEYQAAIADPNEIDNLVKNGEIVQFSYLVCIDYKSTFDERHHQTRLVRTLGWPDHKSGLMMGAFDPQQGVYNELTLSPVLHGDSAD